MLIKSCILIFLIAFSAHNAHIMRQSGTVLFLQLVIFLFQNKICKSCTFKTKWC